MFFATHRLAALRNHPSIEQFQEPPGLFALLSQMPFDGIAQVVLHTIIYPLALRLPVSEHGFL